MGWVSQVKTWVRMAESPQDEGRELRPRPPHQTGCHAPGPLSSSCCLFSECWVTGSSLGKVGGWGRGFVRSLRDT